MAKLFTIIPKKNFKTAWKWKIIKSINQKNVVFNFRKTIYLMVVRAPLTPIFILVATQNKIRLPVCFLNIGGISNITIIKNKENLSTLESKDIGPVKLFDWLLGKK